jgi:hypothetical protein
VTAGQYKCDASVPGCPIKSHIHQVRWDGATYKFDQYLSARLLIGDINAPSRRDPTKLLIVDASVVVDAFDSTSAHHLAADAFLQGANARGFSLVMPMQGFFEVKCAMQRIVHIDKRQIAPRYRAFDSALRMIPQPNENIRHHHGSIWEC